MHRLICLPRRLWIRKVRHGAPLWRRDPVAQMLGVAQYGCPWCGRGAIEARAADRARGLGGDQ